MSATKRNRSDVIWRYMSVAELVSITDRHLLIFRQFRSLRRDDRAEGAIPEDLYDRDTALGEDSKAKAKGLRANIDLRYSTYVQCWHRAAREHSAFWQIYGDRGVAVRAKISRLKREKFWAEHSLRGEDIIYADTWAEVEKQGVTVPLGIMPNRTSMRRKRHAFSWEKEWRIFYSPPASKIGVVDGSLPRDEREIARREWRKRLPEYQEVKVDSVEWISRIIVAPGAPSWVVDTIRLIAKRHGLHCTPSDI